MPKMPYPCFPRARLALRDIGPISLLFVATIGFGSLHSLWAGEPTPSSRPGTPNARSPQGNLAVGGTPATSPIPVAGNVPATTNPSASNVLRSKPAVGGTGRGDTRIAPPRTLLPDGTAGKPLPVPQNPLRVPTSAGAVAAQMGDSAGSWGRSLKDPAIRPAAAEGPATITPLELDGPLPSASAGKSPDSESAAPLAATQTAETASPVVPPVTTPAYPQPAGIAGAGADAASQYRRETAAAGDMPPGDIPTQSAPGIMPAGETAPVPPPNASTPVAPSTTSPAAMPDFFQGAAAGSLPGSGPQPLAGRNADAGLSGSQAPPPLINPPASAAPIPPQARVASNAADWGPGADPASTPPANGATASGAEGTARPGEAALEGPQTTQVTLQKILPGEIQVGKPAIFKIFVRNSGALTVPKLEVRDPIPWGVRVMRTTPQAARGPQGELLWSLGPLAPGDELSLETEVMPLQEGEVGSVATLSVITATSARTVATRPQLVLRAQMPQQVMIGEEVAMVITISNPGSGTATGVVLEEHVPTELQHSAGTDLENWIGDLRPGESREVQLKLRAVRPGSAANLLVARAEGNLRVEDRTVVQVLSPQLDLLVEGADRRFLDRKTIYRITIRNPGTAPARNVQLTATLPGGMQFVAANNAGSYDATTHSVHWLLEELPTNHQGTVELTLLPIAVGTQNLLCAARADLGLAAEHSFPVEVEGIAALSFQVTDLADPVEVGRETGYEIQVVNQGTKAAQNIQLAIVLPEGMRLIGAEGPTAHNVQGDEVLFEKLALLPPKAEVAYRLRVQAATPGDHRIRVQLLSEDIQLPVTREESTRAFTDQ